LHRGCSLRVLTSLAEQAVAVLSALVSLASAGAAAAGR